MRFPLESVFLPVSVSVAETSWHSYQGVNVADAQNPKYLKRETGLISFVPAAGGCFLVAKLEQPSVVTSVARLVSRKPRPLSTRELEAFRVAVSSLATR